MKIPVIGGAYQARSVSLNAQKCINLYPVADEFGGKNVGALYGTPGTSFYCEFPDTIRGCLSSADGNLYVVALNNFYKVDTTGTVTQLGTMALEQTTVSMCEGVDQIMIITTEFGYVYTKSTGVFAGITDIDFVPGGEVTILNSYFVFNEPNTDKFWITGYGDATTIDALEFSYANVEADNIVTIVNVRQELWILGEKTTEVWTYDGNVDFPFNRIEGASQNFGCASKKSVAKVNNDVMFLSRNANGQGQVMMSNGYTLVPVSTPAIDYAISQYSTISDAVAYSYQDEGHTFYVIAFPSGDQTWVYDATIGLWHERAWYDKNGVKHRHRSKYYMYRNGVHYVTDHEYNYLYVMSKSLLTDYNVYEGVADYPDTTYPIKRVRTFQHQHAEGKRIIWKQLQIDMEVGVGLEDNTDPTIQLRWSDDGGRVYGQVHIGSIGKIGEYKHRVIWRRLGSSRDRVFELSTSEPVEVAIIDAYAEIGITNG